MKLEVQENGIIKIDGVKYKYHHTAKFKGYIHRKNWEPKPYYYCGKYGEGIIIERPNWDSSKYSYKDYYLVEEKLG